MQLSEDSLGLTVPQAVEKYPLHVVCAWMGNSQPVAAKHYLQVTDEHFNLAATARSSTPPPKAGALQQAAALCRTESTAIPPRCSEAQT